MFPDHAVEPDQLVIKADQAMYAAKAAGRGRAVLATGS
jgi:predicted signal transduction protein with EAL and GGDEF domain